LIRPGNAFYVAYTSAKCDIIGGTLGVTLFSALQNGRSIPCVKIDHMNAPIPHFGTLMFELCRKLLFLLTPSAPFGYLFAACVHTREPAKSFWPKRLDVTNEAKQLMFQMNFFFDEEFGPDATMRGIRVENEIARS
jgi:hypothetical protein